MRRWLVPVFVGWHLAFLAFRNPVSLKQDAFERWVRHARQEGFVTAKVASLLDGMDRAFIAYEHALALDQGWRMFGAPLDRAPAFPSVVLRFDDGSEVELRSDNEPAEPNRFAWRPAQPRLRKHEALIASSELADMGLESYWERYLSLKCQRWRAQHESDPRRIVELRLIQRRYPIPEPNADPPRYPPASSALIGSIGGSVCDP